jgi:disulfide bond formation protein DsbB
MCWWQRYAHFDALGLAVLALLRPGSAALTALAGAAIAVSGLIGGFHAGVEYGWWEGLTRCTTNAAAGAADPLEAIMNAPIIRCDVAPWDLLGISLAGWNFLFSLAAALAIFLLLARSRKARA